MTFERIGDDRFENAAEGHQCESGLSTLEGILAVQIRAFETGSEGGVFDHREAWPWRRLAGRVRSRIRDRAGQRKTGRIEYFQKTVDDGDDTGRLDAGDRHEERGAERS
jgi:hypothetical protein